MSTIATSMLASATLGLSIAAPIGPMSILCVQRTLAAGLLAGLATGLGAATVHLTYGTLVVNWGAAFASAWSEAGLLSLASGMVLLAFSVRVLCRVVVLGHATEEGRSLSSTYCGAVGFGFLNPITPILFAAAAPALLGQAAAPIPVLVAGVFLGSFGWWVVLTGTVSLLRGRVTCRSLNLANKTAGLLLAALAVSMMVKAGIGREAAPSGRTGSAMHGPSTLPGRSAMAPLYGSDRPARPHPSTGG